MTFKYLQLTTSHQNYPSHSDARYDNHQKISAWIAGGGLLVLGLSPFFTWVKFGAGGVTGLAGDGEAPARRNRGGRCCLYCHNNQTQVAYASPYYPYKPGAL